ncbi:phage major tail tube protein [Flavonifractor plautii]|uniref:phage major tail tube protein n=1 Tax=Flavonifractor plautii TaxID=292800 RepID=UPI00210B3C48|nr:phage major tail tube protein [Flavonifractor plautii]
MSGAGILGEIDYPTIGHYGNMQLEIPFRTLDKEATNMMDQGKRHSETGDNADCQHKG